MTDFFKGEKFCISWGECSDYGFSVYQALEAFDSEEQIKRWLDIHPEQKDEFVLEVDDFIQDMVFRELIMKTSVKEWHLDWHEPLGYKIGRAGDF